MKKYLLDVAKDLFRLVVGIVTVVLAVQAFDKGGWWILWLLLWLPVNFVVMAIFGDGKSSSGNEMAESSTFGND
ncbi:MAG: hypothetical protein H8E37_03675 [Planctomycetes bacterium]|nr:hypothetical protein [Planctomycetota bacterium]